MSTRKPSPGSTARPKVANDTYRKVFDRVADAIIIHDRKTHKIIDVNATALNRYGYTLEEFRTMTPFDLHPKEELDVVHEKIDVRNADDPNEYVHLSKDGQTFSVEILSDQVWYEGTEAWLSIVRDITERNRAQEEVARARDEALMASKHKSAFLAAISHELRTPMNGVLGMVALLLDTGLSTEQRDFSETIQMAGESMLQLINQILDLSKIEAGKLEIEPIPFELKNEIEAVHKILTPRAVESGIELKLQLAPEVNRQRLIGDPGRIRQVVTNLAGNAIKFTKEGHVAMRVRCIGQSNGSMSLQFAVEDTGIGIPEEKIHKIFEEFAQADTSTYRQFGGTGLGLAISKKLVELMGGELHVSSTPDEGSTFWFTLDLETDGKTRDKHIGDPGSGVLVVHGDQGRRHSLEAAVRAEGLPVTSAETSVEALHLIATAGAHGRPFRCGLISYELPDLDGETLGRAISRHRGNDELQLLLLHAEGNDLPDERVQGAGYQGQYVEPVDLRRVGAWLHEIFPDDPESEAKQPPESLAVEDDNTPAKVLVVEDNLVNQKVVAHMLSKMNCETDLATDGRVALEMMEAKRYELIFMDCQMPVMDGYEATRAIRELADDMSRTPVCALTANAMEGDRERCLEAGMDDYMSKPATSNQLAEKLEKWVFARRRVTAPA